MTRKPLARRIGAAMTLLAGLAPAPHAPVAAAGSSPLEEIVVTSRRRAEPVLGHVGNVSRIGEDELDDIRHQHVHELFGRVAGVWLSRGSGQENLTAIRSPVLTGAGSCGAFLTLEDGIPTRPAGFCNVNQLFELNSEQAHAVEVVRGPGSALHGSNALHGIVNVLMPTLDDPAGDNLAAEIGANDYRRLRVQLPTAAPSRYRLALIHVDDGGFRDDSGFTQTKGHLRIGGTLAGGRLNGALSFSDLDQETAGFIFGEDAYRDDAVNRSNRNPEAFRDASSQRLYAIWDRSFPGFDVDVRPYLRHTDMRFLQHFLPGQPLEENGHVSAGVIASFNFDRDRHALITGLDVEWSDVHLRQTQSGPTQGSPFLQETRPAGKHYDFDVRSIGIAPFIQARVDLGRRAQLSAGVRAEFLRYTYDNKMRDGNTRDDGSVCGFGGCLYTRPADRGDDFFNLAPSIGLQYAISKRAGLYFKLARGFRAPQITELYRLQSGQQIADLDSETLDSAEAGLRVAASRWSLDAAVFAMRKRNSVFRDAEGFNVSGARSRHDGAELTLDAMLTRNLRLAMVASYAEHVYDFDRVAARGETFVSGRDVDTAPRWLGSAELRLTPTDDLDLSAQWVVIGPYYLDAENRFTYPGHGIANLRARLDLGAALAISIRLNNVADRNMADRADYAFGNYRYFPGRGRELFVELAYTAQP